MSNLPDGERCPIGPLNLHTYDHGRTECIWCGPNGLAWKPGRWVPNGDGYSSWSVEPAPAEGRAMSTPSEHHTAHTPSTPGEVMNNPPQKALHLTLEIDAHDDADLIRILTQFALDVELGQISLTSSGCSSAGWNYRVERRENPLTPGEYEERLMAWWKGDR